MDRAILSTQEEVCRLNVYGDDSNFVNAIKYKGANWHISSMEVEYYGHDTVLLSRLFSAFSEVDTLSLNTDSTNSIPFRLFATLPRLRFLRIAFNRYSGNFDSGFFVHADSLQSFECCCSSMTVQCDDSSCLDYVNSLARIHEMNSTTSMKDLAVGLKRASRLNSLTLSQFNLKGLSPAFYSLDQVEYIDLNQASIGQLDCEGISRMRNLRTLELRKDAVKEVQKCMKEMDGIKIILN